MHRKATFILGLSIAGAAAAACAGTPLLATPPAASPSGRLVSVPERPVGSSHFDRLEPGAGATLTVALKRYANAPTLAFPWDR